MFDASEIFFLNRAVELHLLTPGQRERLLEYQAQMEAGSNVTTLVVDAGLMIDEEVKRVLNSIAQGVSLNGNGNGNGQGSNGNGNGHAPQAGRPGHATRETIAQLLGDDASDSRDTAKVIAAAIRSVMHDGNPPAVASMNTVRENREAGFGAQAHPAHPGAQAFPMPGDAGQMSQPGQQMPAFPLPAGAAQPLQHQAAMADMAEPSNVTTVDNDAQTAPLKPTQRLAASVDEVSALLSGE